jgi:ankyrin repeat protein
MTEALLKNGADINATDPETGTTPAMRALWGVGSILDLVLRYKPDLSIQTKYEGKTILHWAVEALPIKAGCLSSSRRVRP